MLLLESRHRVPKISLLTDLLVTELNVSAVMHFKAKNFRIILTKKSVFINVHIFN